MKYLLVILSLLFSASCTQAQYSKEKISSILTGDSEKSWMANGINVNRPEKSFTFNINNSVSVEESSGKTYKENWTVSSSDKIRWFLKVGSTTYGLIISYDKKGQQFIKLTHGVSENSSSGYYEIKLSKKN